MVERREHGQLISQGAIHRLLEQLERRGRFKTVLLTLAASNKASMHLTQFALCLYQRVTNMHRMFRELNGGGGLFDDNIGGWNVGSVTNMMEMFLAYVSVIAACLF